MSGLMGATAQNVEDGKSSEAAKQKNDQHQTKENVQVPESIKEINTLTDVNTQGGQREEEKYLEFKRKSSEIKSAALVREMQHLLAKNLEPTGSMQSKEGSKEFGNSRTNPIESKQSPTSRGDYTEISKETTTSIASESEASNILKQELHFQTDSSQKIVKTERTRKRSLVDITLGDLNRSPPAYSISSSKVETQIERLNQFTEPIPESILFFENKAATSSQQILQEASQKVSDTPQTPPPKFTKSLAQLDLKDLLQSYSSDKTTDSSKPLYDSESSASTPEAKVTRRRSYKYVLNSNVEDIIEDDESSNSVEETPGYFLVNQLRAMLQARREELGLLDPPPAVQEPGDDPIINLEVVPAQPMQVNPTIARWCRITMVIIVLVFGCIMLYFAVERLIAFIQFRQRQEDNTQVILNETFNGSR